MHKRGEEKTFSHLGFFKQNPHHKQGEKVGQSGGGEELRKAILWGRKWSAEPMKRKNLEAQVQLIVFFWDAGGPGRGREVLGGTILRGSGKEREGSQVRRDQTSDKENMTQSKNVRNSSGGMGRL